MQSDNEGDFDCIDVPSIKVADAAVVSTLEPAEYPVYTAVNEAQNILSSLVESLNKDQSFLNQVDKMQASEDIGEKKKATMIKTTIKDIRMFNTAEKPLFLAKDIGILLGTTQHINQIVRKYDSEEQVIGYIREPNNKLKKVRFLTKYGIHKCIHTSHSPLSTMLSRFITDLIEETLTKDFKKVKKFAQKFSEKNPELVDEGLSDLQDRIDEYKQKLLEEQARAKLLEQQCSDERKKNTELEDENAELGISQSYSTMHIEQLKKEKKNQLRRISTITQEFIDATNDTSENKELRLLKKIVMKPLYIYILHPTYFKKLMQYSGKNDKPAKPRTNSSLDLLSDTDDDEKDSGVSDATKKQKEKEKAKQKAKQEKQADLAINLVDMETYEKNFKTIYKTETYSRNGKEDAIEEVDIDQEELLYFHLNFTKKAPKKGKLILVDTQYVLHKQHYNKVLETLATDGVTLELGKSTQKTKLFHTSLNEISDIAREELVNFNPN